MARTAMSHNLPILRATVRPPENLSILALHRYWLWADFHKKVMFEQGPPWIGWPLGESQDFPLDAEVRAFDALTALGFFYASLYVVIEGWRDLRLADDEIDALLASENTGHSSPLPKRHLSLSVGRRRPEVHGFPRRCCGAGCVGAVPALGLRTVVQRLGSNDVRLGAEGLRAVAEG